MIDGSHQKAIQVSEYQGQMDVMEAITFMERRNFSKSDSWAGKHAASLSVQICTSFFSLLAFGNARSKFECRSNEQ